jgi:hypothetical protein
MVDKSDVVLILMGFTLFRKDTDKQVNRCSDGV